MSGYNYNEMANLVTNADKRFTTSRSDEPSGEAESLVGRISVAEMGTRVERATVQPKAKRRPQHGDGISGLNYTPIDDESRDIMALIMAFIGQQLEDAPRDVIISAADAILEICKNDGIKDLDKKRLVDDLLDTNLPEQRFSQLLSLTKKISQRGDMDGSHLDDEIENVDFVDSEDGSEDVDVVDESASSDDEVANGHLIESSTKALASPDTKEDPSYIPTHEIDAFWLQRKLGVVISDPHELSQKSTEVMDILSSDEDLRAVENSLMELMNFEHFELVGLLVKNREKIVWLSKLARAEDKSAIEMQLPRWIYAELKGGHNVAEMKSQPVAMSLDGPNVRQPRTVIDLDSMVFEEGNHLKTNTRIRLPQGTTKTSHKSYEEISVPPHKKITTEERVVSISGMPPWTRDAFSGTSTLNRIQSRLYPVAFGTDKNILLCAPTGAGKTNVAMLCILNEMMKFRDSATGKIRLDEFKIVYVAPLKALVQEMVLNFSSRLTSTYGMRVAELTGDQNLTKQQISDTQIIVTTPEKWDVITRKATETSYTNLVRLVIFDEIHLLHDDRGPVIESIVARTFRRIEEMGDYVRMVGLSATLPNYNDVATFLRVEKQALFYFDPSYRPCPLQMKYVGITEKKALKRFTAMNECAYEKVMEQAGKNQTLVFVHSRKETARTAKFIRDRAIELETIINIQRNEGSREILTREAANVADRKLADLLPHGFAIHHAGLSREDRSLAEDLFADGHAQVLVSTATLAWGVNLPAHAVIIKGTQIYSPEKGEWVELSPQDVLQMLGRAGRPQYDTFGEGTLITNNTEMEYYLSLINQQLPIESQFMRKLADNLNAEIVLGTIRSRDDAVTWLGYTYLYVRMISAPALYKVGAEYGDDDELIQKRLDLVHSAAVVLERSKLITYDALTGKLQPTELGRISSHYYITHKSMTTYNTNLGPNMNRIDLFRVFALSEEFKNIPVRDEEKMELQKLLERVPIPIKEGVEESPAKINVLLQSYISRLTMEGFALVSDMVYITQSAGRLMRAIFEICLKRGWSYITKVALEMCKMVERRMWPTMTPLRQFPECQADIIRRIERSSLPFTRYFDLDPAELGEDLKSQKDGRFIHSLLRQFPRIDISASIQPITRSILRMEVVLTPIFEWNDLVHGVSESFWIIVEDGDGENILFHDRFVVRPRYVNEEHVVEFTVAISEPVPPNYFVSVVSDRWMASESKIPVSFHNLLLPDKFPPHTTLLDLQELPLSALQSPEYMAIYENGTGFDKIHTQTFNSLFSTDASFFIGSPSGQEKIICAEFALLRHWSKENAGRAVYIAPFQETVDFRKEQWQQKFRGLGDGVRMVSLTGEITADLKLVAAGNMILATPVQWDNVSRRWRQRRNVQDVGLFIADDIHMIGGHLGSTYEVVVSRMRYMAVQIEKSVRMIGLSVSLANASDLGEWLGANSNAIYNFSPKERPIPLEIHVQSFNNTHFPSLLLAMTKPLYVTLRMVSPTEQVMVFLPSRKYCRTTAVERVSYFASEGLDKSFVYVEKDELEKFVLQIHDDALKDSLSDGIATYHEALDDHDRRLVMRMFKEDIIRVLLVSREMCWQVQCTASVVIVMGTQFFEGKEHRYVDYPLSEVLEMIGKTSRSGMSSTRAILMTNDVKKPYYQRFLVEALPIESQLSHYLADAFVTEVSTKTIESRQDAVDWTTFTFFYRRLLANPSFYGVQDVSHQGLSEFLSDLVETSFKELSDAKIIEVDDVNDLVTPLNGAMIAAYYNISFVTMQTYILSLSGRTKLRGLLEVVSSSAEFEDIPIRRHENSLLSRILERVPVKPSEVNFESPAFKTFILLQAHFSRVSLPADLAVDMRLILQRIANLLSAAVDVLSSDGHLNAMLAMDMSQMCVQAMWNNDSPLKQIPYFTSDIIEECKKEGIESVLDIMDMEDGKRDALLNFDQKQMSQVARFVNKYPSIDISFEIQEGDMTAGESATLSVNLEREVDEDEPVDSTVEAPFFPAIKTENWWIVLGNPSTKQLLAIKRIAFERRRAVELEFEAPGAGEHELKLYFMSDSYVGIDQEFDVKLQTKADTEQAAGNNDEDVQMM